MRRRLLFLSTLVGLALALAVGIEAALAGNPGSLLATGSMSPKTKQPPPDVIVVLRSGYGSGTVTSVPAGIDCGHTCSHPFPHYRAATLTATPAAGSTFGGWRVSRYDSARRGIVVLGVCPGTAASCRVYANHLYPTVVHATFIGHCVVPNVKGETLAAAKRSINSHGCILGTITHAASQTIKKGNVLSQTPTQGKWLAQWARINLAVSTGGP